MKYVTSDYKYMFFKLKINCVSYVNVTLTKILNMNILLKRMYTASFKLSSELIHVDYIL